MNWFKLAIQAVLGIQTLIGDKAAGATKQQMAKDMLSVATASAADDLTGGNAAYAAGASQVAGLIIDQAVTITKASGAYQKATAAAAAAQQDVGVAAAVAALVQSVQNPAP